MSNQFVTYTFVFRSSPFTSQDIYRNLMFISFRLENTRSQNGQISQKSSVLQCATCLNLFSRSFGDRNIQHVNTVKTEKHVCRCSIVIPIHWFLRFHIRLKLWIYVPFTFVCRTIMFWNLYVKSYVTKQWKWILANVEDCSSGKCVYFHIGFDRDIILNEDSSLLMPFVVGKLNAHNIHDDLLNDFIIAFVFHFN